jgi:hypothetical protein
MNLLEEVSGKLPQNKDNMLKVIEKYKNLPEADKLIFRVGRRSGAFRSTNDIADNQELRNQIQKAINDIIKENGGNGLEQFLFEMANQYI